MTKINLSTLQKLPKQTVKEISHKKAPAVVKHSEKYINSDKMDFSFEDRGFFLYNGKVVPLMFPR